MPDISMCGGQGCPQKHKCYRYRARPNLFRQSWYAVAPVLSDGMCDQFLKIYASDLVLETPFSKRPRHD